MSVKDKIGKMLYIDNVSAQAIKEMAKRYKCSESEIMRKALTNYILVYEDIIQKVQNQPNMFLK